MSAASPMTRLAQLGRFRLYRADETMKYPGLHVWTGRGHRQLWPLKRLGRGSDR